MLKDIQRQKQFKILMIGESCEDHYVFGDVNRLNPEAPVPILKKTKKLVKQGMLANVLNNVRSMLDNQCEIDIITNSSEKIKKIRYVDNRSNYQIMRLDVEEKITPFNKIFDKNYDAILISDYNKGLINNENFKSILEKNKDTKIFIDTKKKELSIYNHANCIIKINEKESISASGFDASRTIVTLGSKGCKYQSNNYATKKVEAHDVCGAGDVFLAALVCNYLTCQDIIKSIKKANLCASLSVTKLGCYTISKEEYENLCI